PRDGRKAVPARIVREIRVRLGGEIAALTHESGRLDVEAAPLGGHGQDAGTKRAACGVEPERVFHGSDAVTEGEEFEDVVAGEDAHARTSATAWRRGPRTASCPAPEPAGRWPTRRAAHGWRRRYPAPPRERISRPAGRPRGRPRRAGSGGGRAGGHASRASRTCSPHPGD